MKYLASDATFSDCGKYRYSLTRVLGEGPRLVMFVGLNPSTADGLQDDPTIRRCVGFARAWEFDVLLMANLHAFRSTDPRGLLTVADPVGPDNVDTVKKFSMRAETIVAAWGANQLHPVAEELGCWLAALPRTFCFGLTKNGSPKHPLYLPKDSVLRRV